jgi:hypothetical protein
VARRIYARGWHFQIVVAGKEGETLPFQPLPMPKEIRAHLAETKALLEQGQPFAALLLAWSMFEAAARLRMMDDDRDPAKPATPGSLIKGLIYYGYIDEQQAASLEDAMKLRNAVAHGFLGSLPPEDVAHATRLLIEATEPLLQGPPPG